MPQLACTMPAASSPSVRNTMHLLDVDPLRVPLVDDRLTGDALAATLATAAEPETVVAVVANAGSTNAGLVDDLAGVARVCDERSLWMHVDAAYGGGGLLARSTRPLFDGIELADSLVVDPHKWFFIPMTAALLLTRERDEARRGFATKHGSYIPGDDLVDAWLRGMPTSRRSSGLAVWNCSASSRSRVLACTSSNSPTLEIAITA